jgi:hypothetical protein
MYVTILCMFESITVHGYGIGLMHIYIYVVVDIGACELRCYKLLSLSNRLHTVVL